MAETRKNWHPAFVQAFRLELEQYQDVLEFFPEYQLSSEPLRIDVVVVKKLKNVTIDKNIATIFKTDNIVEFKSPEDYVSVEDFYKVYGYACFYLTREANPPTKQPLITDLTISFIESRYPRDLIAHLEKIRGYTIEKKAPGIYTVSGDIIPIQIINSRELSTDENLWLRDLTNDLDKTAARQVLLEIGRRGKAAQMGAYLDILLRANVAVIEEAIEMGDTTVTIEEVLERAGFYARAEERKSVTIAKNALAQGLSEETIVAITGLKPETIRELALGPITLPL
jgi:hypothetical protein